MVRAGRADGGMPGPDLRVWRHGCYVNFASVSPREFFCPDGFKIWNCHGIAIGEPEDLTAEYASYAEEVFTEALEGNEWEKHFWLPGWTVVRFAFENQSTNFSNFYSHPQQPPNRNDTKACEHLPVGHQADEKPGV